MVNDGTVTVDFTLKTDADGGDPAGGSSTATDNAPMINAAQAYACANGYDTVLLSAGIFRIGSDTNGPAWDGVRVDVDTCPQGLRSFGRGMGQTTLLNNMHNGGFMWEISDKAGATTSIGGARDGIWGTGNGATNTYVTGINLGADPPVITFNQEPENMHEADMEVFIRNCHGIVELNDRYWRLQNCTDVSTWTCDLYDTSGVAVDSSTLSAWVVGPNRNGLQDINPIDAPTSGSAGDAVIPETSSCSITPAHREAVFEVAHMTIWDDAPLAHQQIICDGPGSTCKDNSEESHGIRGIISGGKLWIHDIHIPRMGDEGLDMSGQETVMIIEDNFFDNIPGGAIVANTMSNSVIRNNRFDQSAPLPYFIAAGDGYGDTYFPAMDAGTQIQVGPLGGNARVYNLLIEGNHFIGELNDGIGIRTYDPNDYTDFSARTGNPGQVVDLVTVRNNDFSSTARPEKCDDNGSPDGEPCYAISINADSGQTMGRVTVEGNTLTGGMRVLGANGDGVMAQIVIDDNLIVPVVGTEDTIGVFLRTPGTVFSNNIVEGFERSCIHYHPPTKTDKVVIGVAAWDQVNDEVDFNAGHGFVAGDRVQFSEGTPPTIISNATDYWLVLGTGDDSFRLSPAPIGNPEFCDDVNSTGGPPQTGGDADGKCDDDGTTPRFQILDLSAGTPANLSITTVIVDHDQLAISIEGNSRLSCIGKTGTTEFVISPGDNGTPAPARPITEEYFRVIDNTIIMQKESWLIGGIRINKSYRGVKLIGNQVMATAEILGDRDVGISVSSGASIVKDNIVDGFFDQSGIFIGNADPTQEDGGPIGYNLIKDNKINLHDRDTTRLFGSYASGPGTGRGIHANGALGVRIIGNQISNTGDTGIEIQTNAAQGQIDSHYIIDSNYLVNVGQIQGGGYGMEFSCVSCVTIIGARITDNIVDMRGIKSHDGIRLTNVWQSSVIRNRFLNFGAAANGDAVDFLGTSDFNLCLLNHATGGSGGFQAGDIECASDLGTNGVGCRSTGASGIGDNSICDFNITEF